MLSAQHVHINGGAANSAVGTPLSFINGPSYNTNAGYDVYLTWTDTGVFANRYQGAGVTFTSLASTLDYGGPAFGHAAEGAFLQLQFVSLSGPPGGEFGVWFLDPDGSPEPALLFALPAGTQSGTNLLALSENDGSPGSDPYGHIHGRTFTATQPGLYTLGCRLVDTSANGPGGGPIHAPSPTYYFYFQAGLTASLWSKDADSFRVTFGTATGKTYYVESATDPAATVWTPFAGPFTGNNYLQTAVTNSVAAPQSFFRVRAD